MKKELKWKRLKVDKTNMTYINGKEEAREFLIKNNFVDITRVK